MFAGFRLNGETWRKWSISPLLALSCGLSQKAVGRLCVSVGDKSKNKTSLMYLLVSCVEISVEVISCSCV